MAHFSSLTLWKLEAPIDRVWSALHDTVSWPTWWRYVLRVVPLEPGAANGEGGRWRLVWHTALFYSLAFEACVVRVQPPHLLDAETHGELKGMGRWRLSESGGVTEARYHWDVSTTKAWMNALAPLLAPAFRWNHEHVMVAGAEGLARHLGVRLLRAESVPIATAERQT
jgi:hypothetical protein